VAQSVPQTKRSSISSIVSNQSEPAAGSLTADSTDDVCLRCALVVILLDYIHILNLFTFAVYFVISLSFVALTQLH